MLYFDLMSFFARFLVLANLKQIAQECGLSIRTVNRVLKNMPNVREETRKRVLEAVDKLSYHANRYARSLKTQRGYEVIVVAWSYDELHMVKIAGLEQKLRDSDYSVSIIFEDVFSKGKLSESFIEEIVARKPAGVVILPERGMDETFLMQSFKAQKIPYAFMDSQKQFIDSVKIDRQQGVFESINYLATTGKTKIAYLGPEDPTRLNGYYEAMAKLKLKPMWIKAKETPIWSDSTETEKTLIETINKLLKSQNIPDAIQAYSDRMAMILIGCAHERRIKIPQELAVVGFDDRILARYCWPSLTTVAQPNFEVGQLTGEILINKIEGKPTPTSNWPITIPTKLIVRHST